ncbi:LysR family transcriptional regulator [Ectopseudomonas mendocina]|uniref:LysR family transcriptional regulator n=1 Tax=Ectopseudomonas mendocina TaxID=300 RepID=A0ABZ2RI01_ECTME
MNNLRNVDLNLLVTLQALLEEKHISRAALRLHKSQPAISHALANLRRQFNDPLLIRRDGGLELTPRATELLPALNIALGHLGEVLGTPPFDPLDSKRTLRLAMSDFGARVVLPQLIRRLRQDAPGIDLVITHGSREAMLADVTDGEVDMALGVFPGRLSGRLRTQTLFEERFVCVADAATVPRRSALSLKDWLARPHILVATRSAAENEIERALAQAGLQRRIAVQLPHWSVANELIAGTDLILTVAERNLQSIRGDARFKCFKPPVEISAFDFQLIWHQRRDGDVAQHWLRERVVEICQIPKGKTQPVV